MGAELEICANCERKIGKLEQAYLHNDQPVCGECYARLTGNPANVRGHVTTERTGKVYKAALIGFAALAAVGALVWWQYSGYVVGVFGRDIDVAGVGGAMLFTGVVMFVLTRLKIWWEHG